MGTAESAARLNRRVEQRVGVVEHRAVDLRRVGVELGDVIYFVRLDVVERRVMRVLTEHRIAELDVLAGVQDVRVPEGIDDVRDGVLVTRVEQGDGVVLLQGKDALGNVLVADLLTLLGEFFTNLPVHARIVLIVNPEQTPPMEVRHWHGNRIDQRPHGSSSLSIGVATRMRRA